MRKKLLFLLYHFCFTLYLAFSINRPVCAAGFSLKSISGVDTSGRQLSHWWYTGLQPTFSGEAPGSSAVDIVIDGTSYQTAANAAGAWEFTPPSALSAGDHQISITNNNSTISFTLTLGTENVDWTAISSGGTETLPTVGIFLPTLFLLSSGTGLIILGRKFD